MDDTSISFSGGIAMPTGLQLKFRRVSVLRHRLRVSAASISCLSVRCNIRSDLIADLHIDQMSPPAAVDIFDEHEPSTGWIDLPFADHAHDDRSLAFTLVFLLDDDRVRADAVFLY